MYCNNVIHIVNPEFILNLLFEYLVEVLKISFPFCLSILVCKNRHDVIAVHVKKVKIIIGRRL